MYTLYMKSIHAIILLLILSINGHAKTLTIGVDLSGSNPLLTHKNFAYEAAKFVNKHVTALKTGDVVYIRSFGARGDASNIPNFEFIVSRRMKARAIAAQISQFLQSLPKRENIAQSSTNLIAWLEFSNDFECQDQGQIIGITDGLESSSYVDALKFLEGKAQFPKPDVDLSGCEIIFYGLGAGFSPQQVKMIRNA